MPRALIIGGGVAGPAVALFLQRAGWEVTVFEAREEPDDYTGLFLNVATNGLAVLDTLGLRDRLVSDGHRAPTMMMWSSTGKRLGSVPNGPTGERERGSVIVKRGWLHEVMRTGATGAGVEIVYGARLTRIEETDDFVRGYFADGRVEEGDILIGCDGIGSLTRQYIDADAPAPMYSGLVGLGGFAYVGGLSATPDAQHFIFGARSFFGYLVRDDGTVYWFANVTHSEASREQLENIPWLDRLRDLHADDPSPVPQILATATGELGAYPIYDLSGVKHWHHGRVVAVGDAVHATSPSAGQGASLALEDAATLAACLHNPPSYSTAFAEYQRQRQPRAEAVVKYARAINAQKRVTKSRIGIAIRDALMPLFLRQAAKDTRNDWLYNYHVSPLTDPGQ